MAKEHTRTRVLPRTNVPIMGLASGSSREEINQAHSQTYMLPTRGRGRILKTERRQNFGTEAVKAMLDTSERRRRHITNFSNTRGRRLKFITTESNMITKATGILFKTGTVERR
jgi:hypothetical protein